MQTWSSKDVCKYPGFSAGLHSPCPHFVDLLGAMVNWVEKGTAPASMIATGKAFPRRSRPLCPYPKHAHYKGQGNTKDANNFECR
jgi:Tannase and feruloyl esterase